MPTYGAEYPTDWDQYTDMLTFSYNTQCHESTGIAPFDMVISRPKTECFIEVPPNEGKLSKREYRASRLNRLRKNMDQTSTQMKTRQARYPRQYDRMVAKMKRPVVGDYVFVRLEQPPGKTKKSFR